MNKEHKISGGILGDACCSECGRTREDIEDNGGDCIKGERKQVSERPPLGLVPEFVHKECRAEEILLAMVRYSDADKVIPKEWIEELRDLMKGMKWGGYES